MTAVSGAGAPLLSKKQQNKSVAGKKKALKPIKNLITCSEAIFWPLLTDEHEQKQVVDLIKALSMNVDEKRKDIKFGINEISRSIANNNCSAVLLDDAVPRVLVMHILSNVIIKQIPLLCIKGFDSVVKECFGFKSSSACFTNMNTDVSSNISALCQKNFKADYESIDNLQSKEIRSDPTPLENKPSASATSSTEPDDFIKFDEGPKRRAVLQPLLIKRVRSNTNRRNNKKDV